jgi:excisionase family DNA binding protein
MNHSKPNSSEDFSSSLPLHTNPLSCEGLAHELPLSAQLLTCEELAKELGVVPDTVRKWAILRILPSIKIGRNYTRYDRDDVRRALAKYRQEAVIK